MGNPISLQFVLFYALFCTLFLSKFSTADDIISSTQFIRDRETLVSAKEEFELGFFSPGSSTKRYLGIWYKKIDIRTIVWVANRNNPISNSTGILEFDDQGNLILVNGLASIMWSSNASKVPNPVAQLLDTGNFVIREEGNLNPAEYLWQSFDYPSDTLLPGMKMGWNLKTGIERYLTSWRTVDDPAIGDYIDRIDLHGLPQSYIFKGPVPNFRCGSWNGLQFNGIPVTHSDIFNFSYVTNQDEEYYAFYLKNQSTYSRVVMNCTGKIERYIWLGSGKGWNRFWTFPNDNCDNYVKCGAYGVCDQVKDNTGDPLCNCLKGYKPKYPKYWSYRDWSGGCVRKTKSECQENDGFFTMGKMKLPDTSRSYVFESISMEECRVECLNNCSCKAYAAHDVTNGWRGCIIWTDDLKDVRVMVLGGQDLYVRLPASELDSGVSTKTESTHKRKKPVKLIVTLTAISATLLLGLSICFIWKKKMKHSMQNNSLERRAYMERSSDSPLWEASIHTRDHPGEKKDDSELVLFEMDTIVKATSNFSSVNMLGQGGFGCVYKGSLTDGQDIAVKRLSAASGQGVEEFLNEVVLIAKLQHRNLVRLLGSCIDGDEKMLIYEYMENKGLDSILFNKAYNSLLDWPKRFKIIMGISRGLLYLHQDSRFRIVHRDLKASNILLDGEMNPKISDFGIARIFGGDDTEGITKRVVGTYGYMSPEYAMDGLFSVKSDVFSFGVLLLEVISGKKNKGFYCSDNQLNLLTHAWNLWREGQALELIDESMGNSCRPQEALRCMQVGLLCVQERAEDRPTMSSVVLMLSSDSATFPEPRQPGFSYVRNPNESESSSSKNVSINIMTTTLLEPR